jgi:pimeloyl-ACP methyl ester carboxylesterase
MTATKLRWSRSTSVFALVLGFLLASTATSGAGQVQAPAAAGGDFAGLVDIGGRNIYLECRGTGSPTVILESGFRNDADIWSVPLGDTQTMVLPEVAKYTRVCAYDRPGTILDLDRRSRSDPVPMPRTLPEIVAELHALLRAADVPGPYILAAHSLGGLMVRLYASTYPGEVSGMVLVDAVPDGLPALLSAEDYATFEQLTTQPPPGLEDYGDLEYVDFLAASNLVHQQSVEQPLPPMPMAILARGLPIDLPSNAPPGFSAEFEQAWRQGEEELAALTPDARFTVAAESDHYIQQEQSALVTEAIRQVVAGVRDPDTWFDLTSCCAQ